jgi:predicted RNA-binding protein with EMAP domain
MAQTLGSVIIDVQADTQKLVQGFDRAEKRVNKATKTMSNAIKTMAVSYLSFQEISKKTELVQLLKQWKN